MFHRDSPKKLLSYTCLRCIYMLQIFTTGLHSGYQSRIIQRIRWQNAGRPGFDSTQGRRFFSSPPRPNRCWVQINLLSNKYLGLFHWEQSGRSVTLTNHLYLIPRLTASRASTPCLIALHGTVLTARKFYIMTTYQLRKFIKASECKPAAILKLLCSLYWFSCSLVWASCYRYQVSQFNGHSNCTKKSVVWTSEVVMFLDVWQ